MNTKEFFGLYQKAVLWPATPGAMADAYGNKRVDASVEINVRWEWQRNKVSSSGPEGRNETEQVAAVVATDRDIPIGSILWLGEKKNFPYKPDELVEVNRRGGIPDVKGQDVAYEFNCARWSGTLPGAI